MSPETSVHLAPNASQPSSLQVIKRASKERGYTNIDWLKSYHSFSFGEYHDSKHMGFGNLRVINDDVIAPARGFGTHPHRDMEIITIVLSGELAHRDSIGNGTSILPNDVQRMSAGTGIEHSEFNASKTQDTRLLQIWVFPEARGLKPSYEQKNIPAADMQNKLCLIAARTGGAITIHQDLDLYRTQIDAGKSVTFDVKPGRMVWVQVATGALNVNGQELVEGDALSFSPNYGPNPHSGAVSGGQQDLQSVTINLQAKSGSDVLIFDQQA